MEHGKKPTDLAKMLKVLTNQLVLSGESSLPNPDAVPEDALIFNEFGDPMAH